jgi:sugar phosphate isomerase/epimerase
MKTSPVVVATSDLRMGALPDNRSRVWSFITLGCGHCEARWRRFCYPMRMVGYDRWLSIEHEYVLLSSEEGIWQSIALLKTMAPIEAAYYKPQKL